MSQCCWSILWEGSETLFKPLTLFFPFLFCNVWGSESKEMGWFEFFTPASIMTPRWSFITESYSGRESKCGMMGYVGPPLSTTIRFPLLVDDGVNVWTLHLPYVDLPRGADSVVKQFGKYLRKLDSSPDGLNPSVIIFSLLHCLMAGSISHLSGNPHFFN